MNKHLIVATVALASLVCGASEVTVLESGAPIATLTLDGSHRQATIEASGVMRKISACTPHNEDRDERCSDPAAAVPMKPRISVAWRGEDALHVLLTVSEHSCSAYEVVKGGVDGKSGQPNFLLMPADCQRVSTEVKAKKDGSVVNLRSGVSAGAFAGNYSVTVKTATK